MDNSETQVGEKVNTALTTDAITSITGETVIGLNPKARIVTEFLETENVYGTAYIAFDHNLAYRTGGRNNSVNHVNFLVSEPAITVDNADGGMQTILEGAVSV